MACPTFKAVTSTSVTCRCEPIIGNLVSHYLSSNCLLTSTSVQLRQHPAPREVPDNIYPVERCCRVGSHQHILVLL